jgi:hypothetical protein
MKWTEELTLLSLVFVQSFRLRYGIVKAYFRQTVGLGIVVRSKEHLCCRIAYLDLCFAGTS